MTKLYECEFEDMDINDFEKLVVNSKSSINEIDPDSGMTLLHHTVLDDDFKEYAKVLLKHGANFNQKDSFGETAKDIAALNLSTNIQDELLEFIKELPQEQNKAETFSDKKVLGSTTFSQESTTGTRQNTTDFGQREASLVVPPVK